MKGFKDDRENYCSGSDINLRVNKVREKNAYLLTRHRFTIGFCFIFTYSFAFFVVYLAVH